jgi:putative membrane protein
MMGYGAGFAHPGLFWGLVGLVLLVGLVVLVVWAVSRATRGVPSASPDRVDALEILRLRFARGEITEAEFLQAKKALGYDR